MEVYLHYLSSSIPTINNMDAISNAVTSAINSFLFIKEPINVVPLKCTKIVNGSDIHVVIAGKCPVTNPTALSNIQKRVFDAIQLDQNTIKPYKVGSIPKSV